MKYNRAAMENAARAALRSSRTDHETALQKAKQKHAAEVKAWNEKYADAWLAACRAISRKVRAGNPVTGDDLPQSTSQYRCNEPALYSSAPTYAPWQAPANIENALLRLAAVGFEVMSARQLDELGIDRRTVAQLSRFMAPGSVTA